MSSNTGISPHATAFATSYANATSLSAPGTPTALDASATAMSTHYLPNLVSFTLGTTTTIPTPESAQTGTLLHLQKLQKANVGTDIRLVRVAVKEISEFAAAVFVTWELVVEAKKKEDGGRGWRWRNCYGYRRVVDAEGKVVREGWEYIVSDEEVGELIKRVPKYFEL